MNFDKQTRILVVAAHPDDEVLGCGGTLALASEAGATISVLFLGEGVSARFPFGKYDSKEFQDQTQVRTAGSKKALESLGITNVIFGKELCCQFDTVPILVLTKAIEAEMERFKPTHLFTHNPSEVNNDHRITYNAVEIACRPTRSWVPREIYTFEIVCSGNWTFNNTFKPNVFVDISSTWEKKITAWHHYEGESRTFPFPRSDTGLLTLAQFRGMNAGIAKAEAFRLVRKIVS